MKVNLGSNNTISDIQFGNDNVMYISSIKEEGLLHEKDWNELADVIEKRLTSFANEKPTQMVAREALQYTYNRDEKSLKKFIKENKDIFFTNVLSGVVSAGLMSLLN